MKSLLVTDFYLNLIEQVKCILDKKAGWLLILRALVNVTVSTKGDL